MKKLVQINVVCNGSTGKIMCDIAKEAKKKNYQIYCFFGRGKGNDNLNCIKIGSKFSILFHAFIARFGFNGHGSYLATKKLVKEIKKINPDIIHLHNVHGYYINLKVLFKYLKSEYQGKIIWTLHDCWAFTGHCAYFTMAKCNKWKKECVNCPQLKSYPKQLIDRTKKEYYLKKELFTGLKKMVIVTPSIWLKDLVKKSFLKNYDIKVINNGIDLNIFKPTYDGNIFEKYGIPKDKKIILGVANIWEERKGLKDFIELSKMISDEYQIVLIGVDDSIINKLPPNVIGIKRTDNAVELAKIYSIALFLFNPTIEDNYPTINLESIACGTPVITYDTGGCKEQIYSYEGGFIVDKHDYENVLKIITSNRKNKNKKNDNMSLLHMVSNYIQIYKE